MTGLLGVMAAGAARGARDASNMNVQEQNINQREALRQHYETEKYSRMRKDAKEDSANAGEANQRIREEDRANKLSDTELDREFKAGESAKERESKRSIAALRENAKGGGKGGGSGEDGLYFDPLSKEGKAVADMLRFKRFTDPDEAYKVVYAAQLMGYAASSIAGMTDGAMKVAQDYANKLFPDKPGKSTNVSRTYNPQTGTFE